MLDKTHESIAGICGTDPDPTGRGDCRDECPSDPKREHDRGDKTYRATNQKLWKQTRSRSVLFLENLNLREAAAHLLLSAGRRDSTSKGGAELKATALS